MKTYREGQVQLHIFLYSVLDGSKWSDSRSNRFKPWEMAPSAH
jgi:hypothetical protein